MDAIPDATDEDAAKVPNIFYTFQRWMVNMGRKEGTARTYARQMVVLFEEDYKTPAGMATNEYFLLTKNSWKNKSGNSQRSASVKAFMEFWLDHGNKPMEDSNGDKRFQVKTRSDKRSKDLAALSATESEEARKLRAELELPKEGWSVVVRNRESGDLIAAVSPGGTAYYTREAVDRRLGRRRAGGAEPPPVSLPPSVADAAKPSKEEVSRQGASSSEDKAAPRKPSAAAESAAEAKKDGKKDAKKEESKKDGKKEEARKDDAKKEAKKEEAKKEEARKEEAKKEAKKEEARKEEAKKEEAKKAEAKKEEARKEEAKKEEAKKAEAKEEARKEEANKEEAKKAEAKKEEAKKEEAKEEVKDEDVKKEEVKTEEDAAPADIKQEAKQEANVKEEVKEEDDLAAIQSELEAMMGTKDESKDESDKRSRRRKHHEKDAALGGSQEVPDLSTPQVETDTEYPGIELDSCPDKIAVRESGSHKTDGSYLKMLDPSRGKPCYVKWGEKPMYLFWNKKWKIGMEFGASKSFAMAKDAGTLTPCEPYPHVWKVMEKKDKKEKKEKEDKEDKKDKEKQYVKNMSMRVIDGEVLELSIESEAPEFAVPDEDGGRASKRVKRRVFAPTDAPGDEAAPGSEDAAAKKPAPAANGTAPDSEAAGPAESDKEEEADERANEAESSQSESNSSESSSSESGASDSEDEKKPPPKEEVKAAAPKLQPWQLTEQKSAEFETKLRNQLDGMAPAGRGPKLKQVKDLLMTKVGMQQVTGMGPEQIQVMISKLCREYAVNPASLVAPPPLPKPKPPQLPPPSWLLEKQKAQAQAQAAPQLEEAARAQFAAADPAAAGNDRWRQPPKRSALRRPGAPRQNRRRITYRDDGWMITQVDVESFRSCGEQLWFIAPGSFVACDNCEKEVSQAMGSLQGAPMQSQFAQNKFLCSDCSGLA